MIRETRDREENERDKGWRGRRENKIGGRKRKKKIKKYISFPSHVVVSTHLSFFLF